MQRRFVIHDMEYYEPPITETELDSRLIAIYGLDGDGMFLSRAKQTLLHGAGGQCMPIDKLNAEKEQPTRKEMKHPKCPVCGRSDPVERTRKEWEEWASDEPDPMSYGERDEYWKAKKQWFLTMPGVPKAKPPQSKGER